MGFSEALEAVVRLTGTRATAAMQVQSLMFDRSRGWTVVKARRWAGDHGYKYGKVDETDEYIHLRQRDPAEFKVIRTITWGEGIKARVGR